MNVVFWKTVSLFQICITLFDEFRNSLLYFYCLFINWATIIYLFPKNLSHGISCFMNLTNSVYAEELHRSAGLWYLSHVRGVATFPFFTSWFSSRIDLSRASIWWRHQKFRMIFWHESLPHRIEKRYFKRGSTVTF